MKKDKSVKSNKIAAEFFDAIVEHLEAYGVVDDVDVKWVNIAAISYTHYSEKMQMVVEHGDINRTENGFVQVNGYLSAADKYLKMFESASKQLGLSPWARNNLNDLFERKAKTYKIKKVDSFIVDEEDRPNAEA